MTRILITDDAAFMRHMVKSILIKEGFEIAGEATNGVEAVSLYESTKPDVALLDITMPQMDGIEAVKKIKEVDPNAKIIMVSALGHQAKIIEALEAGALDFIVKPFEPARIIEAIKRVQG